VTLETLNEIGPAEAEVEFMRCCGSREWARWMTKARPFGSNDALFEKADALWLSLKKRDWLEAFSHHPRIGDGSRLAAKFASTAAWAVGEQKGTQGASSETLSRLKTLNEEYEKRFDHVFLICATGKSADEMLQNLESRIDNSPEQELEIAANEQMKITRLRLEKLLA
jgi:2-oxo-4-hydroxy-4-carboxy-5-ureidoimidazoline decarboxylase